MSCWRHSLNKAAKNHGCAFNSTRRSLHSTGRPFLSYFSGHYYGEGEACCWSSASLNSQTTKISTTKINHRHQWLHNNQNHSRRHFSSQVLVPRIKAHCPFRTLNIKKDATYAHAKKAFLKIAMKHHPDTVGNDCKETQQKSQEIFMKCRKALEALVECDETGKCLLRSEVEKTEVATKKNMSDEEFDTWFEQETGHKNAFQFDLDPATMREVASMHDDMAGSHGLDRDGGMWHLASMISSAVKSGKEGGAQSVLKLEAGNVKPGEEVEAQGKLERRRKRRRGRGGS